MVDGGGERATVLAERLALAKPTVTAAVDGLVERRYLAREPVAGDRRAVRITVTSAGRRALREAEASMAGRLDEVLDRVGSRREVLAALARVETALDDLLAERRAELVR
jgi:DNA-binding MarR family transcriptional regulator